jgi:N6-L-threonylcarbamoyladenine synthase
MEHGGLACHLSGAETQCQRWIANGTYPNAMIAAEIFDFLARTVAHMVRAGCETAAVGQALVVGGVASSALLRRLTEQRLAKMVDGIDLRFGKPEYSGDNAAGVAWLGMQSYLSAKQGD